jgi:NADH-quinone oxidoreductase chain I
MQIVDHIKNLLKGLGIAGKHLGRHAITIQYPEERMEMTERSRGIVVLLSDKETGELNCTSCELCMRACPTAAIKIVSHRDENKKRVLDEFVVDNGLCCFCGLCEEACAFSALKMATKYEFSTRDKDELVWDVAKLQQVGRDVDYVDTRKKKKPKADKPAEAKTTNDSAAPAKSEAANDTARPTETPGADTEERQPAPPAPEAAKTESTAPAVATKEPPAAAIPDVPTSPPEVTKPQAVNDHSSEDKEKEQGGQADANT